jgi:hypothetical protein
MTLATRLYHVHIYREMRLYFAGLEASSPQEAARIASQKPTDEADTIDDCEGETLAALVDIDGDSEYAQTQLIDFKAPRRAEIQEMLQSVLLALDHHAHWLPGMPSHLASLIHRTLVLTQTL